MTMECAHSSRMRAPYTSVFVLYCIVILNTGYSVSVAFNEVVFRSVASVDGAVVVGAVDFGGSESHVMRKQFTLTVWRLARTHVAPAPRRCAAVTPSHTPLRGHVSVGS